jgi:hypothetical protein
VQPVDLPGAWHYVASPLASLVTAIVILILLIRRGYHRDRSGAITRRRLASVFGLAASSYTFAVCVLSQLFVGGPDVAHLIERGFGSERVAWLLLIVVLDQCFRLWDEFRPA